MIYNPGPVGPVGRYGPTPIFDRSTLPTYRDGRAGTFYRTSDGDWQAMHGWGKVVPDAEHGHKVDFNSLTPDGYHSHHRLRPGVGWVGGREEGEPNWTNYNPPIPGDRGF